VNHTANLRPWASLFLTPDLDTFMASVIFWDEGIGLGRLGSVQASGTATIPETGSTFARYWLLWD